MATDQLFELIKSLSKNERMYFQKNANLYTGGEKIKYMKLFDVLCKMNEYDEKFVRLRLDAEPSLRNIQASKIVLQEAILHVLESYYPTVRSEILGCLHQVEILKQKGLVKLCGKKLARAEFLARKYELVEFLIPILSWKYMLCPNELNRIDYEKFINSLGSAIKDVMTQLKEDAWIKDEHYQIMGKVRYTDPTKKSEESVVLLELALRLSKVDVNSLQTFYTKYNHLAVLRTLYSSIGNATEQLRYLELIQSLFLSNPHMIEYELKMFLWNLNEKVSCELIQGLIERTLDSFRLLEVLNPESGAQRKLVDMVLHNLKLGHCIHLGEFEAAKKHSLTLLQIFKKMNQGLQFAEERNLVLIRAAILNFALCDYKESLKYIQEMLVSTEQWIATDTRSFAQLFQLVLFYEKGDLELIEYRLRAVTRTLFQSKGKLQKDKILVDFFKVNSGLIPVMNEKDAFLELEDKLKKVLKGNQDEKSVLCHFNLSDWITSHIVDKSYLVLIKERHKILLESEGGRELVNYLRQD